MNKWVYSVSAILIVAVLATVGFVSLFDANSRNASLENNLSDLEERYDELQANYYNLLGNFSSLKWNYTSLLMQNPTDVPNPGDSGADNVTAQARLQALQALYANLKAEYDQYVADYQQLRGMTEVRLLRGDATVMITPRRS